MNRLAISDNVHPNTDGSPWGWIVVEGTKVRVATYSGHEEKKRCKELVSVYNNSINRSRDDIHMERLAQDRMNIIGGVHPDNR